MNVQFLVFDDSIVRAGASAGAATNARISVNDVDVSFGNSANWAFIDASATSDTFVCDFVSHDSLIFSVSLSFEIANIVQCLILCMGKC